MSVCVCVCICVSNSPEGRILLQLLWARCGVAMANSASVKRITSWSVCACALASICAFADASLPYLKRCNKG